MSAKNKNCADLLFDICSAQVFCQPFFHLSRSEHAGRGKLKALATV